ncbi:MAG: tRNA (adenosine(37)-N6)-dimethylallyltransferase MiaA [Oscillospiraceae bacterium]|nr:tRNA (adenosine(37)-N6)-dimethylallyltransferase MiaA [Oscillospiraceae bacterium]
MKLSKKPKITVICGPTASGKTKISVELAKALGAEIISADSMQIYKELSIGTAKPSAGEMSGIKHHLIDIISVKSAADEPFSVAKYVQMAGECAGELIKSGKKVIVCGGTGLYIDHFINNTKFAECQSDIGYREELDKLPTDRLYSLLSFTDGQSAALIHPNNRKRIVRALEIFKMTGKTKSELDELSRPEEPAYDFVKIGLNYPDREVLYGNIDRRTDSMMAGGLADEALKLYEGGGEAVIRKIGAIGYAELFDCFAGLCGVGEAVEKIKQHTRNYAKRQLTWFKRDPSTLWLEPDGGCVEKCADLCR